MSDPSDTSPPIEARRYAAALSEHPDAAVAAGEVVGRVEEQLGAGPDLAVLFVSGDHCAEIDAIAEVVRALLVPGILLAVTSVGVIGGGREVEADRAVSLWAGRIEGLRPLRLEPMAGVGPDVIGLPDDLEAGSVVILLADPFTVPVDRVADELTGRGVGIALVGGLASAAGAPGGNVLLLDDGRHDDGAVGVIVPPGIASPVVSQGCRPIGDPWVVTKGEGQLIAELAGRPALERLQEMIEGLTAEDRALAARGLHIGVVADEQQLDFDQGDFLIRAVLGADRSSGAVAIGDQVRIGQVVQFQVRDEASASAELQRLAAAADGDGVLLFTCNGRGSHMFSVPDHDAGTVYELVGDAVGGMFCAGELGPIAERNAVHGFTATMAVFR